MNRPQAASNAPRSPGSIAVLLAATLLAGCEQQAETPAAAAAPPPAVTVISVQPTEVTPSITFNGRVVAVDLVELRARVTGFLEQRLFDEGTDVKAGDLLFVIEKAPYEATVAQRQAELASAEANKANTAAQLARGEELVKNDNIPRSEVDIRRADDQMAAAEIQEARAALERAQINLSYTDIHAPIDGRISRSAFSVGNLVGPDSGMLATIVSQDPIYVTFPVSQRQLLEYRREQRDVGGAPLVRVTLPDGTLYEHPGKIDFLDVQVDPGTDTVTVRAELPNPERTLVDGQFLNVRVERGQPELVLAIPQAALQVDQAGPYVLVVAGDDKVETRRVTLSASEGAQAIVREGLKEGERVIVEGIQKVRPGMTVAATEAPPAGPAPGQGAARPAAQDQPPAQAGEHGTPGTEPASGRAPAARDEQAPAQAGEPGAATGEAADGQAPAAQPETPQAEPGKAANAGEQAPAAQDASPPLAGATDAASEAPGGQAPAAPAPPQAEPGDAASQAPAAPRLPEAKPGGVAGEPAPPNAQ
jgi:membrane fusion protein (multidrug efflux system)